MTREPPATMKLRLFMSACCTVLAAFGCGETRQQNSARYSWPNGDFVDFSNGHGTAKIMGINFDIPESTGGTVATKSDGFYSNDPEKTNFRNGFTVGDVKVQLEKLPGKPLALEFNDRHYGTLEAGDKVTIDKERKVSVNGSLREPKY